MANAFKNGASGQNKDRIMPRLPRLPKRVPPGTKYVLESRGRFVRRYIEFPDGRRINLSTRKALSCGCVELQKLSIVPEQTVAAAPVPSQREVASTD
jgi:hypothetical protein